MSLVAPVKEGKVQETGTTTSKAKEEAKAKNGGLDKEAFLSLLVAEMQNQDPLEPTTNTEYISQLATFSSLEEMQNMSKSYEISRSVELVGKEVYLKNTNSTTGSTNYIHGIVDYVQMSGKDALLSVNGQLYSIDDLDSVYDQTYSTAYNMAYNWNVDLNKLPALSKVTEADRSAIEALRESYDKMDDYQKTFIASDNVKRLQEYEAQLETIKNVANNNKNDSATTGNSDSKTDNSSNSSTSTNDTNSSSGTEAAANASSSSASSNTSDNSSTSSEETTGTASTEAAATASSAVAEEKNVEEASDELTDEELEALTNG